MRKLINKTFICESTYFSCEQVVRTEAHLKKMYKLCKKIQDFEINKRNLEFCFKNNHFSFSKMYLKSNLDKSDIGMKIKVIDNERVF